MSFNGLSRRESILRMECMDDCMSTISKLNKLRERKSHTIRGHLTHINIICDAITVLHKAISSSHIVY